MYAFSPSGVLDQGDEAGPVGVVLDRLDGRVDRRPLVSLEVDDAVQLLVAAAAVLGGDDAVVVAAVGATLRRLVRRLSGLELGQDRLGSQDQSPRAGPADVGL
jgi:hypothetical protein